MAPTSPEPTIVTPALLREWKIPAAPRKSVLVVGGAQTVPGAVLLTGTAALRAGAGTLKLAASDRHAVALGVAVPEAAVMGLPESSSGSISRKASSLLNDAVAKAQTVVIGPGLTDIEETVALLARLLPLIGQHALIVLDAFALGAISRRPALVAPVQHRVVFTPNLTEAAYLLDCPNEKITDYAPAALKIARKYGAVVTLMGGIAHPDGRTWLEQGGHIGLGTSGSGDVLAGLVGGFLARSADLAQAACWATHIHAMAGQQLIPQTGATGMLARELLTQVPKVIAELE